MTEVNLIFLFFSHEDRTKAHDEQLKNKNQRASMQKLMYFLTSLPRTPLLLQQVQSTIIINLFLYHRAWQRKKTTASKRWPPYPTISKRSEFTNSQIPEWSW